MRVAVVVAGPDVAEVARVYDDMSRGLYTHATPTLFNAGMRVQQCSSCFRGDTPVPTLNAGVKAIRDVAVGDLVVSHLGNVRPVTQVHRNALSGRRLRRLTVGDARSGIAPVVATEDHRFWAASARDGKRPDWVAAGDLVPGYHYVATLPTTARGLAERLRDGGGASGGARGARGATPAFERVLANDEVPPLSSGCARRRSSSRISSSRAFSGGGRRASARGERDDEDEDVVGDDEDGEEDDGEEAVYTLGVEGDHSYAVGDAGRGFGVLAENCYLLGTDDSLGGIFKTLADCAQISKWAGGIGLHVSNVRAKGSRIASTNGTRWGACRPPDPPAWGMGVGCSMLGIPRGFHGDHGGSMGIMGIHGGSMGIHEGSMGIHEDSWGFHGDHGDSWGFRGDSMGIMGIHGDSMGNADAMRRHAMPCDAMPCDRSDGIVPMLKVYNECARYCNQSGRRKGSIAVYLEPWHADVWEFVELRRNVGAETERTRDLFLALWVPDEFMRRLEADQDWFLMTPDLCPGLVDAFDEEEAGGSGGGGGSFSRLYNAYVAEGKYVKKVRARALWQHVLNCQLETGVPYVMFKDSVNRKCNQSNVGTIRSSNLCVAPETRVLTDSGYHAIASLADRGVRVWNGKAWAETVVHRTGVDRPLLSVRLSNGETLECTPDHRFYLCGSSAPVPASELKAGDALLEFALPPAGVPDAELRTGFRYAYTHGKLCAGALLPEVAASLEGHVADRFVVPVNYAREEKLRWLEGLIDGQPQQLSSQEEEDQAEDDGDAPPLVVASDNAAFLRDVRRLLETLGVSAKGAKDAPAIEVAARDVRALRALGLFSSSSGASGSKHNKKASASASAASPSGGVRLTVVGVVDEGRRDDTYCFTEPLEGKGVFEGVLTGQCAEITEYSDHESYAVCNLASIAVSKFVLDLEGARDIDFAGLHEAAKQVTRNLNRVIDVNTYPTRESESSNVALRPIGVGVQGLGDVYCKLGLPYDDPRAVRLDAEVMEAIYHGCLEASCELAERDGPYSRFAGSPASEGRLQLDLWGVRRPASGRYDWDAMRERVKTSGLRNSLLTALMPTATTSQILGNCESFEPIQVGPSRRAAHPGGPIQAHPGVPPPRPPCAPSAEGEGEGGGAFGAGGYVGLLTCVLSH